MQPVRWKADPQHLRTQALGDVTLQWECVDGDGPPAGRDPDEPVAEMERLQRTRPCIDAQQLAGAVGGRPHVWRGEADVADAVRVHLDPPDEASARRELEKSLRARNPCRPAADSDATRVRVYMRPCDHAVRCRVDADRA